MTAGMTDQTNENSEEHKHFISPYRDDFLS
jgi:hypothetical protein